MALEPYIYEDDQAFLLYKDVLAQEGFQIFQEREVVLTLDDIKFLTSGQKTNEDQMDQIVTKLLIPYRLLAYRRLLRQQRLDNGLLIEFWISYTVGVEHLFLFIYFKFIKLY